MKKHDNWLDMLPYLQEVLKSMKKLTWREFENNLKRIARNNITSVNGYLYSKHDRRFHKIDEVTGKVMKDENGKFIFDENAYVKTCRYKLIGDIFEVFVAYMLTYHKTLEFGMLEEDYTFVGDSDADEGVDAYGKLGANDNSLGFVQCKFRSNPNTDYICNPPPFDKNVWFSLKGQAQEDYGFDNGCNQLLIFVTNIPREKSMTVRFKERIGYVSKGGRPVCKNGIILGFEDIQKAVDGQNKFWERLKKEVF